MAELERRVILQDNKASEGVSQFKVTIPSDFVNLLGWEKGDGLKVSLVFGSGKLCIERGD